MTLKPREKIMIGVALLVGLVMGFDQFVTLPKKKEMAVLEKEIAAANEKLGAVSMAVAGLKGIKKRVEEKRKQKELSAGKVTDARQLDYLLDYMSKQSQTKQFELTQLSISEGVPGVPSGSNEKPGSAAGQKMKLEIGLMGLFEALGPYLDGLQTLPIFLEVERISINRKEVAFPKLEITLHQALHMSKPGARGGATKPNVQQNQTPS